jgi:hypothetical protein
VVLLNSLFPSDFKLVLFYVNTHLPILAICPANLRFLHVITLKKCDEFKLRTSCNFLRISQTQYKHNVNYRSDDGRSRYL